MAAPHLAGSHVVKVLLLAALVSSQQYVRAPPQYQVQDNGERAHAHAAAPVDYTAYLSGPPAKAQATEEKGFVEPIDFSGLFAGASGGVVALAPRPNTVKDFFAAANSERDPFSLALGSATNNFPSEVEVLAEQNNGTGFTNPQVKFQSLFDISGSASQVGFRPQDFLQPKKASEEEQQSSEEADVYSPSYSGITSDYKPSYSKPAAVAPSYRSGSKDHVRYHASPSEEQKVHSGEDYSGQTNYKPKYASSFAASPSNYQNKYLSEVAPGKSSYPAPSTSPALYSSPETYKPLSSEVRPEKSNIQAESYGGYSSYAPPNTEFRPKNADYSSDATATQQGKSAHPSTATGYGAKLLDGNGSPNEKNTYASSPSELYKQFGIESPQPSTVNQASPDTYGNTAAPHSPKAPSFGAYSSGSSNPGPYLPQATDYRNIPTHYGQIYEKRGAATQPKEADATENKEKKCQKVEKHVSSDDLVKGRFRREAMSCFVCEDPKTKLSYEKCSYEPEPQGSNYFKGQTQSYKVNLARAPGFRFRRDLEKIVFDFEKEWDLETEKIYPRKVRQQSGYGYGDKDSYKYGPGYFEPYFEDRYTSPAEYAPSASAPDPKNCKKVEKDKMTCYECTDPKNGGTSEQCSYSAKPKEKNYFIAHETSFNRDSKSKQPQRNRRGFSSKGDGIAEESSHTPREESASEFGYKGEKGDRPASSEEEKTYAPSEYGAPSESRESKSAGHGYQPYSYSVPDYYSSLKDKKSEGSGRVELYFEPGRSYDEYFKRLFPELVEAEKTPASSDDSEKYAKPIYTYSPPSSSESKSQHLKTAPPGFFTNNESKKDLHKVLGDFSKKDWSSCKKISRDKMTCYQCIDKNGLQHEECMFVAASEPKNQHLAYHEVKEFRLVPTDNDNQSASASDTQSNAAPSNDSISSPSDLSEETNIHSCAPASSKALPSTLTPTIATKPKRKTFFKKVTTTSAPTDSKVDETQRQPKKTKLRGGETKSPAVNARLTRRSSQSATSSRRASPTTPPPTALQEEQPARRLVRRKVTMSTSDMVESASNVNNKKRARPKQQAPLPSEPQLSDRDRSPDGYYSAETRTRFDPVLKVTLPEYMLSRSEHEAIFDEVMASGRKH